MFEITLNDNLRPCERQAFPVLHPLIDLTQDPEAARYLIRMAYRIFGLGPQVRYSGFVRKLDQYDGVPGPFGPNVYIQIWEKVMLRRTFAMRGTGYVGIIHVETDTSDYLKDINEDDDVLGRVFTALESPDMAEKCIGYVGDYNLEIRIPMNDAISEPLR